MKQPFPISLCADKPAALIASVLLMISCEKEIQMRIEDSPKTLVVNTLAEAGKSWDVEVSTSKPILGTEDISLVNDATVLVTAHGQTYTLTNQGSGRYSIAGGVIEEGAEYSLSVTHPDYPPVSAVCTIPLKIPILSAEIVGSTKEDYLLEYVLRIRFADPKGKNYYRFSISRTEIIVGYKSDSLGYIIDTLPTDTSYSTTNVPYRFGLSSPYKDQNADCFPDELFDGTETAIDINIEQQWFTGFGNYNQPVHIQLENLTPDYYRYLLTQSAYSAAYGDPFAQPVHLHNNIAGGYGIFAGQTLSDTVTVTANE